MREFVLKLFGSENVDLFPQNTSTPNSANNRLPLGINNDDESAEKVMEFMGPVVEQLNEVIDVEVNIGDELVKIPVQRFLVGHEVYL